MRHEQQRPLAGGSPRGAFSTSSAFSQLPSRSRIIRYSFTSAGTQRSYIHPASTDALLMPPHLPLHPTFLR